jgi:plastocyanin
MGKGRVIAVVALFAAAALVAFATGCSGGGGATTAPTGAAPSAGTGTSAGGAVVVMKDFAFDNASPSMKAGESITFKNDDSAPHEIKIDGKDSGVIDPGKSWSVAIAKAGSYPFSCTIHPSMTGQLTVQ